MNASNLFLSPRRLAALALLAVASFASPAWSANTPAKPTIVLVHGAFAESSSWNDVIRILAGKGYPVVAVGNPLRSVKTDAAEVSATVASIDGPVVLVGHSYGGSVISNVKLDAGKVKGLVFVAAFAPEAGESAAGLSGKFPGSTLKPALAPPVPLADGGVSISIRPEQFHAQFAADVPARTAALMAATQRPITEAALVEGSGEPAWKTIPSWFVYGDRDRNIPAEALGYMAERAHSRETVVVRGASHVVMVSNPNAVAKLIEHAAQDRR